MQKRNEYRFNVLCLGLLSLAGVFLFANIAGSLISCSGVQTVKPYEVGRVTAETILFDARVQENSKAITPAQFDEVRKVYDQLKVAQDIAIDARKAVVKTNTAPDALTKSNLAMSNVLILSTRLLTLAQTIGINVK